MNTSFWVDSTLAQNLREVDRQLLDRSSRTSHDAAALLEHIRETKALSVEECRVKRERAEMRRAGIRREVEETRVKDESHFTYRNDEPLRVGRVEETVTNRPKPVRAVKVWGPCKIEGCDRPIVTLKRGLCSMHRQRERLAKAPQCIEYDCTRPAVALERCDACYRVEARRRKEEA